MEWLDALAVVVVLAGMSLFFLDRLSAANALGNGIAVLSGVAFAWLVVLMRKQKHGSPLGSIVLGLYDEKGRLIHVGNAGTGFNQDNAGDLWRRMKKLETDQSPFHGKVETSRRVHFLKPELVAEIKFTEWTHEGNSGQVKMRAPVFLGIRADKSPKECRFERPAHTSDVKPAA